MKEIKLNTFLRHFTNNCNQKIRYCFILGAGASKQSGIPTGSELVKIWFDEIKSYYDEAEVIEWINSKKIDETKIAEYYPFIYEKRFGLDPNEGYAFLEKIMVNAEPSCGYSVLSQILITTNHNIVITTNFDSLTEDALFIYTSKKPLVVGHESLASYVNLFVNRPIVAKIHRDILLSPKNDSNGTSCLEKNWEDALSNIFKYYTPLVIGYGGNDGSLMGYLDKLDKIAGGIFWFYRDGTEKPSQNILSLIDKHDGFLVQIDGFDELMIQLGETLNYRRMDDEIIAIAQKRASRYREQIEKIIRTDSKSSGKALKTIVNRGIKNWWAYQLAINNEKEISKKEELFIKGIKNFPKSSELYNNYAIFTFEHKKDHIKTEELYNKSIELDPNNSLVIGNYANFLRKIKFDYVNAETLYKKAIELDPNNSLTIASYASFLDEIKNEHCYAETLYKKAIELDPNNSAAIGNYANYLRITKNEYDKAEELYKKAIELNPNNILAITNYASFLVEIKNDQSQAETLYKKAIELDPNNSAAICNYATYLRVTKNEYDKAEELYKKAIELDPNDSSIITNYAVYLTDIKNDLSASENLFKKAIELRPNDPNYYANYSKLLILLNKFDEALVQINKAFGLINRESEVLIELWFYKYAIYDEFSKEAESKLEYLLSKGFKSIGWDLSKITSIALDKGHPNIEKLKKIEKLITQK